MIKMQYLPFRVWSTQKGWVGVYLVDINALNIVLWIDWIFLPFPKQSPLPGFESFAGRRNVNQVSGRLWKFWPKKGSDCSRRATHCDWLPPSENAFQLCLQNSTPSAWSPFRRYKILIFAPQESCQDTLKVMWVSDWVSEWLLFIWFTDIMVWLWTQIKKIKKIKKNPRIENSKKFQHLPIFLHGYIRQFHDIFQLLAVLIVYLMDQHTIQIMTFWIIQIPYKSLTLSSWWWSSGN